MPTGNSSELPPAAKAFFGYDVPPKLIYGPAPVYPISQVFDRKPGQATVIFTVGADGKTKDIKVFSATNKFFGAHTAIAAKDWRYSPALKNGKPVEAKVRRTIKFRVEGWG